MNYVADTSNFCIDPGYVFYYVSNDICHPEKSESMLFIIPMG